MVRRWLSDIRTALRDSEAARAITADLTYNAVLRNTISITGLKGSDKTNVIPPVATAAIDVRLLPGQDPAAFLADLTRVVGDSAVTIRPQGPNWPATESSTETEMFRAITAVAHARDPRAIPAASTEPTSASVSKRCGLACASTTTWCRASRRSEASTNARRDSRRPRRRVLHVAVEPVDHFSERVQHGLPCHVPVRFVGQHHQTRRAAQPLDSRKEAFRVDREGARVVVGLAVRHQDRFVDRVGVHEGRHPQVHRARLPERAVLVLEAERRERPVVGARARDAGPEQVRVR